MKIKVKNQYLLKRRFSNHQSYITFVNKYQIFLFKGFLFSYMPKTLSSSWTSWTSWIR